MTFAFHVKNKRKVYSVLKYERDIYTYFQWWVQIENLCKMLLVAIRNFFKLKTLNLLKSLIFKNDQLKIFLIGE